MNRVASLESPRRGTSARTCFFLVFCLSIASPGRALDDEVSLIVAHTTDVRGHVLSLQYREWRRHQGGLLRCATLLKKIRGEGRPILLIDCGDLLIGSPESRLTGGRLPLEAANWLRYDARIPGRMDVERMYGEGLLEQETTIPLVAANLEVDPSAVHLALNHRPWLPKILNGVRIALIGLGASPGEPVERLSSRPWTWLPDEVGLDRALREARAWKPDLMILAAHHAIRVLAGDRPGSLSGLLRRYPEFDLVLGGRSGAAIHQARIGDMMAAQAGSRARWLGRVDVRFDRARGKILHLRSELLDVGPTVEEDASLRQVLGHQLGRIERTLEEVVGQTELPIGGAQPRPGQTAVRTLLALAVRSAVPADVVLWGGKDTGYFHRGEIRVADILRAIPAEPVWSVLVLPAVQLRRILAENAELLGTDRFLGAYGMVYDYFPGETDPIRHLRFENGDVPHGHENLTVLVPDRCLWPSVEGRSTLRAIAAGPESRRRRIDLDTYRVVTEYVRDQSPLRVRPARGMLWSGEDS